MAPTTLDELLDKYAPRAYGPASEAYADEELHVLDRSGEGGGLRGRQGEGAVWPRELRPITSVAVVEELLAVQQGASNVAELAAATLKAPDIPFVHWYT